MMQEGGRKTIGGATELSDLSVVWEDGGKVAGKTVETTVESSVLDAPTMGTVYLADPDKLSLVPKRKHRIGIDQLGSQISLIYWSHKSFGVTLCFKVVTV